MRLYRFGIGSLIWVAISTLSVEAGGVRSFKSGPIQSTADGQSVWVVNTHSDSVTRIRTSDDAATEFALPDPAQRDRPLGLSVHEDGSRVWVTAHDADRIYVLDGTSGAVVQTLALPWGSGPHGIALSRPDGEGRQRWALAALHRGDALAIVDTATYQLTILDPVFISPMAVAWDEDGNSAWVTHLFTDGERPRLTRVDISGPSPKVRASLLIDPADPQQDLALSHPDPARNIAEGGYLQLRGHPAQLPSALTGGTQQLWLPVQYHNITQGRYTPDSTIQAVLRKFDLTNHRLDDADKIVFTARHVHDPLQGNNASWQGFGWDASISGMVDLGFLQHGSTVHGVMIGEQSNDLIAFRWNTGPIRSTIDPAAPGLVETAVGSRPMGLTVLPTAPTAYVYNALSFDISVVDLSTPDSPVELRRIGLPGPLPSDLHANATLLQGALLFHTADDARISGNGKVACASCHINAEHDGRSWFFEGLPPGSAGQGHGPRATPSMLGIGATHTPGQLDPDYNQLGQLHRSGDRDEIQDFEWTYQGALMGGSGFLGGAVHPELGLPNRGRDADLDAMAAYLLALPPLPRSPHRDASNGLLTESAQRGASFFKGSDSANRAADANCASCHAPATAFVDFRYHDVGQRRDATEAELDDPARPCTWCVRTPTLIGTWHAPPFTGVTGFPETFLDAMVDYGDPSRPSPHGNFGGLTGRQQIDLATFVLSLDGNTTPSEVAAAGDTAPPRFERVEATSRSRVEVFFNESIDPTSAVDPSHYRITRVDTGEVVPVTAVTLGSRNGDRVTLETNLTASCAGVDYRVEPVGGILDLAASASGGSANPIDTGDAGNAHIVRLSDRLTIDFGTSGYENLDVRVHDRSPVGPFLQTWGHDSLRLFNVDGPPNPGFLRFDWRDALVQATGITDSADLLEAAFEIEPEFGEAQPVEVRRVLQSWDDPLTGGDWNNNPVGAPTWRDHAHPGQPWNISGARALGGSGGQLSDYDGPFDLSATTDALTVMPAINEPVRFQSVGLTDAYRFWFDNPQVDYGHALRLVTTPPAFAEVKVHRAEAEYSRHSPRLELTYRVPTEPVSELSSDPSRQLRVDRSAGELLLRFEDRGALAVAYNVYEGTIGNWYSHTPVNCGVTTTAGASGLEAWVTPSSGDRYYLVTASDCSEGPIGVDSSGQPRGSEACP